MSLTPEQIKAAFAKARNHFDDGYAALTVPEENREIAAHTGVLRKVESFGALEQLCLIAGVDGNAKDHIINIALGHGIDPAGRKEKWPHLSAAARAYLDDVDRLEAEAAIVLARELGFQASLERRRNLETPPSQTQSYRG